MLLNYFKIAWRNLQKNKIFSFINVLGLAIGMASAILILLWIANEISFDRFHKNTDRIYMAYNRGKFDGKLWCWNATPKILGKTLKSDYPEIDDVVRYNEATFLLTVGDKHLIESASFVDSGLLKMFSFPLVKGSISNALGGRYSIVITEKLAKKLFGNDDPMGKIIKIDSSDNFTVTGVLKDLPTNTSFQFSYLLPWSYMTKLGWDDNWWGNNSIKTYVMLKPNVSLAAVNSKIRDITIKHSNGTENQEVFLYPMEKWHLYSRFENGVAVGGRIETVHLFIIIASFILLIACINFMNLSTARSEKRAKEVGIRKVAGANRGSLIAQFMSESVLISFIAGIIALVLVELFLPRFNYLVNAALTVPFGNPYFWLSSLLFVLFTGVLAGSYPAFFLASFKPVKVLKGSFKKAHAAVNPRKVLVVLQFTFAIILVISTCVVVQQINYAENRDAGYDKSQLVYVGINGDISKHFNIIKNELLSQHIASSITRTNSPITQRYSDTWGFVWQGKNPGDKTDFIRMVEDEGLSKTVGLSLVQGRDMDLTNYPTDSTAIVLNQSAVKAMGFKEPIGQIITEDSSKYHVIGVVKDFLISSPYEPIEPMVIQGASLNWFNIIHIKLNPQNSISQNLASLERVFKKYNPQYPFEYKFVDEEYAQKFNDTKRTASLAGLFAGLTIFISCLGLFALATFMAESRIKEIGVRKVLGASVYSITSLLSKQFLALVIIAILIASPIAWWAMNKWLQGFTYRIDIQWWVFLLAGIGSIALALLTVSFQAIRAAIANPVKSLRTE